MTTDETPISKPRPNFPLTVHKHAKQWCKKIRGKTYYFGPLSDPQAALDRWLHDKDYLLAGRTPPDNNDEGLNIEDLVNRFLASKERLLNSGELHRQTFIDYYGSSKVLVEFFGRRTLVENLTSEDFAKYRAHLAKDCALTTLKNRIKRATAIFNYAVANDLVDKVRFGTEFNMPSIKAIRINKTKRPTRILTADEIRSLLTYKGRNLKAAILLGINCGLGNTDIANLDLSHLDLDGGWLTYPRGKTGVHRRSKLWPETIQALRVVLAKRRKPADPADSNAVFITRYGHRYITYSGDVTKGKGFTNDSLCRFFNHLLATMGFDRSGVGFYSLRHAYRTAADAALDSPAINKTMGHESGHISTEYLHKIDDSRLERVSQVVHDWLFPSKSEVVQ